MLMNLCVLLFFAISNCFADINKDRDTVLKDVKRSVIKSQEYQELKKKIIELEYRVENNNNKKTTVKTIGYTSSTLGVISSIWAIYEKTLSLKNSKIELDIRNSIKDRILIELETIKDEHLLNKKRENLGEINEKIANINMRMRISRMGLYRGIFKGVTSVGLFVVTIFVDDIAEYFHNRGKTKQEVYTEFLNNWDTQIVQAQILPSKNESIETKALMYLVSNDKDWDTALEQYKLFNYYGYLQMQLLAKQGLEQMLKQSLNRSLYNILIQNDEQNHDGYYKTKVDGTYFKINIDRRLKL